MVNVENILKVAQAIEDAAKPEAKPAMGFNMDTWCTRLKATDPRKDLTGHACRTVACVGGWTQAVLAEKRARHSKHHWETDTPATRQAAMLLGLGGDVAEALFFPGYFSRAYDATPAQAVRVLRNLAETGIVDWDRALREVP